MKLLTCSVFLLVIGICINPALPFSIQKVVNKLGGKDQDAKKGPQSDNSIHQTASHGFVPSQIKCKYHFVAMWHPSFIVQPHCSQSRRSKSVIRAP